MIASPVFSPSPTAGRAESTSECARWDDGVRALDGHLLQSWRWGEFKARHGWDVERIRVGGDHSPMAQILFRRRGPVSVGYIPRGPVFRTGDEEGTRALFAGIDRLCKARRALYLIVEPDRPLPFRGNFKASGFVRGPEHIQPSRTVKVPLLDDELLLGQMHQKTRYSVRLADRRGVIIERTPPRSDEVHSLYELLRDTSHRNDFGIHSETYYTDFLQLFGSDASLMFAQVDGVRAAGLIAAKFGDEAIYMYGGSSTEHRAHGAAFRLQFEAMRWAREAGCIRYDLWGIPNHDPNTGDDHGDRVAGTRGDDWRGLYKFKVGFGGEIVSYPLTLERRYNRVAAFAARRLSGSLR